MLKRLLVPTDFSPTSARAFQYSLELASRTGGTVVLYHIFEPAEAKMVDHETSRTAYNEQLETNLMKELNRLAHRFQSDYPNVMVSTVLGRTPLTDNILGFAEHHHIQLIIMGTQGASGLTKTLMGTVASRITEKAAIPVLLIPESYEWQLPATMILATDYQPADKTALPFLVQLSQIFHASVTVLRLVNGHATNDDLQREQTRFEEYASELKHGMGEQELNFQLIKTSSVSETLEKLDDEIPYDLLVMVRRKKNFLQRFFFESFTRNMAYLTRFPFLMVPAEE